MSQDVQFGQTPFRVACNWDIIFLVSNSDAAPNIEIEYYTNTTYWVPTIYILVITNNIQSPGCLTIYPPPTTYKIRG